MVDYARKKDGTVDRTKLSKKDRGDIASRQIDSDAYDTGGTDLMGQMRASQSMDHELKKKQGKTTARLERKAEAKRHPSARKSGKGSGTSAKVAFAPYQDKIQVAKTEARKKLKAKKARSYYGG